MKAFIMMIVTINISKKLSAYSVCAAFIDSRETTNSAELINSIDRRQIRVCQIFYTTLNTPLFRFCYRLSIKYLSTCFV